MPYFFLSLTDCCYLLSLVRFDFAANQTPCRALGVLWVPTQYQYLLMFILKNNSNCMNFLRHNLNISATVCEFGTKQKDVAIRSSSYSVISPWCSKEYVKTTFPDG